MSYSQSEADLIRENAELKANYARLSTANDRNSRLADQYLTLTKVYTQEGIRQRQEIEKLTANHAESKAFYEDAVRQLESMRLERDELTASNALLKVQLKAQGQELQREKEIHAWASAEMEQDQKEAKLLKAKNTQLQKALDAVAPLMNRLVASNARMREVFEKHTDHECGCELCIEGVGILAETPTASLAAITAPLEARIAELEGELSACKESPGGCGYWREAARKAQSLAAIQDAARAEERAACAQLLDKVASQCATTIPRWLLSDSAAAIRSRGNGGESKP